MNEDPMLSHEEEAAIRRMLQEAARTAADGAPDHIEKRLLGALRRRRMMRVARFTLTGAVAAALMAGLWLRTPPEEMPAPVAAERVEPPPAAEQVETASANLPSPVERKRTRRPARAKAVAPPAAFIPVGAWQAMEPMERGSIVRVRLPLSAIQGLGIPVSGGRWSESVPAEVVLGEDGTMRAVRIVNTRQ